MIITPLTVSLIPQIEELMRTAAPYVTVRSSSDYWMYATLFSTTCPVALIDDEVAGAVIAFRSQDQPADIYIQDVATAPAYRGRRIAGQLIASVHEFASKNGSSTIYLTSEPDNAIAHKTWTRLGFINTPGTQIKNGIHVTKDFKGPGKDRAVYELNV